MKLALAGLTSTEPAEEAEEDDIMEIEGVLIGPNGHVVTEDGVIVSASKLTVPQLKVELSARGLSTDGKRPDLYRRVQVRGLAAAAQPSAELITEFCSSCNQGDYNLSCCSLLLGTFKFLEKEFLKFFLLAQKNDRIVRLVVSMAGRYSLQQLHVLTDRPAACMTSALLCVSAAGLSAAFQAFEHCDLHPASRISSQYAGLLHRF